jgi:hypothetical protein
VVAVAADNRTHKRAERGRALTRLRLRVDADERYGKLPDAAALSTMAREIGAAPPKRHQLEGAHGVHTASTGEAANEPREHARHVDWPVKSKKKKTK